MLRDRIQLFILLLFASYTYAQIGLTAAPDLTLSNTQAIAVPTSANESGFRATVVSDGAIEATVRFLRDLKMLVLESSGLFSLLWRLLPRQSSLRGALIILMLMSILDERPDG